MRRLLSLLLITSVQISATLFAGAQTFESTAKQTLNERTKFQNARALSDGSGVWLHWEMERETGNLGFSVQRFGNGKFFQVTPSLIPGSKLRNGLLQAAGGVYEFFDESGSPGSIYRIETISEFNDDSPVIDVFTEVVTDLLSFTGRSSSELRESYQNSLRQIETTEPLLPKALSNESQEFSRTPDINRQRLIASRPGVKIGTSKEGIYRVSRIELENAGFNVNSAPENWQLYLNGNEQSIIVEPSGGYIEFYGRGMDTVESGMQIYFLTNGSEPGKRIENKVLRRMGGNVVSRSYNSAYSLTARAIYFTQIRNGSANNFFNFLFNTTGVSVPFSLSAINRSAETAKVSISVHGLTEIPHTVEVKINGNFLGTLSGNGIQMMRRDFIVPLSVLNVGANTLELKAPNSSNDYNVLDNLTIELSRRYEADSDRLSFYTDNYKQVELSGFTSRDIRVFDVTESDEPKILFNLENTSSEAGAGVIIPANRGRRLFASSATGLRQADLVSANVPSSLSTPTHSSRYLIITHRDWLAEANQWSEYRRADGFSSEVVAVDDIYDEFSYGVTSSMAVRTFLQFAKENWSVPPDYVLILGDASYDPRLYRPLPNTNFVPTFMFDTAYEETGSDDGLTDFDSDGLAEIPIGRIPAKTAAEVAAALTRTMRFEKSAGFSRGALFASDLPLGYDFAGMSQRLASELPAGTNSVMVNRGDANSRATLLSQLNSGKYLVNYSGHGAPSLWAASSFYYYTDVSALSNGDNYSIFTMLTCLNGYFLETSFDSLAELLLKAPNGGAAAAWASSGKTTPDVQEVLARRFYRKISEGKILRIGDLVRDAKQNLIGGRDVRLSWTLFGDPALKVH